MWRHRSSKRFSSQKLLCIWASILLFFFTGTGLLLPTQTHVDNVQGPKHIHTIPAIAELLDPLGAFYLHTSLPATGAELFIFAVRLIKGADRSTSLRILGFVRDKEPGLTWGVVAASSTNATQLEVECEWLTEGSAKVLKRTTGSIDQRHYRSGEPFQTDFECQVPRQLVGRNSSRVLLVVKNGGQLPGGLTPRIPFTIVESLKPKPYFLGNCLAPIFGRPDRKAWIEWLEYHRIVIGLERVTLYVRNATEVISELKDYVQEGYVQVRQFETCATEKAFNESRGYYDETLARVHCLTMSKGVGEWHVMNDLDEYVVPGKATQSLQEVLRALPGNVGELAVERRRFPVDKMGDSDLMLIERILNHSAKSDENLPKPIYRVSLVREAFTHAVINFEPSVVPARTVEVHEIVCRINHYRAIPSQKSGTELADRVQIHDNQAPFDVVDSPEDSISRFADLVKPFVQERLMKDRLEKLLKMRPDVS